MTASGVRNGSCAAAISVLLAVWTLAGATPARAQNAAAERHRIPADFMSYLGADWLERGERITEEQPERVLDAMGLRPGDVVADVGCGSGYYARRIARRVQPGGTVYCEDIQPEMLDIMRERAAAEGVTGIEAVLGAPDDPRLPEGAVDWIIITDVYHEMSEPEAMLAGIRRALAPGGRVALLEYRAEDGTGDHILADHAMSVRQVLPAGSDAGGGAVLADHDLVDAIDSGLVEVEARGAGVEAVTLRIRRTGNDPIVITSPAATYFDAEDARDMIARRDGWVVLDDDGWREWTLRAVGRQRGLEPPGTGDRLAVRPPSTAPVIEDLLLEIQAGTYTVSNSPLLYPPRTPVMEQAAVWIVDGDADYAEMAPHIAGPMLPAQYAAAFALIFVDRVGVDVTRRRVWADREQVFGRLRDQGLRVWYQLKTRGR